MQLVELPYDEHVESSPVQALPVHVHWRKHAALDWKGTVPHAAGAPLHTPTQLQPPLEQADELA